MRHKRLLIPAATLILVASVTGIIAAQGSPPVKPAPRKAITVAVQPAAAPAADTAPISAAPAGQAEPAAVPAAQTPPAAAVPASSCSAADQQELDNARNNLVAWKVKMTGLGQKTDPASYDSMAHIWSDEILYESSKDCV